MVVPSGGGVQARPLGAATAKDAYLVWRRALHGRRLALEAFERKYATEYLGLSGVAQVGYQEGRPVGFYGAMPMPLQWGGEVFVGVQLCDFATLREFRGRGVHGALRSAVLEACRETGTRFVFALHTDVSWRSSSRMNWQMERPLRAVVLSRRRGAAGLLQRIPWLRHLQRRRVSRWLTAHRLAPDAVLRELTELDEDSVRVKYSAAYFQHRSYTNNGWIRVAPNVLAWISVDANLRVGALVGAADSETTRAALEGILRVRRTLGLGICHYQAGADDAWLVELSRTAAVEPTSGFRATAFWADGEVAKPALGFRLADYDTF